MVAFVATLIGVTLIAILIQLITKMRIVGGNELGIVSGKGGVKGFRSLSGRRVFVIPLLNAFAKLDLTPHTIEVRVDSAIASGVVPLNVKATVSFAIASNEAGRMRAVTRILSLATSWENMRTTASDIIEGHLRDSIASITPEQVMKDKDTLVAKMINVCKSDLENIGLEITTMNIADVDDHRLDGVDEPDLYIALLKRVQTANAETKAREARANAKAASVEQEEARRAEVQVRTLENELENLIAETRVDVKEEHQRRVVGVEQAQRDAAARVEGLKHQRVAEEQGIAMLKTKFEAEKITPALAEKERMVLEARAKAARMRAKAQAEIDQLKTTFDIVAKSGKGGSDAYVLENFESIITPFAETLSFFPVDRVSVITGVEGSHGPISAIHPSAVDVEKNTLIGGAIGEALSGATEGRGRSARASRDGGGRWYARSEANPADDKPAEGSLDDLDVER
ncbi:MAG: SPFH domain-containing protein [Spirochaetota bacterium]